MSSTATATASTQDDNNNSNNNNDKLHVVVVVLGDVGRSPRMQYHALSLLEAGHDVSLVGYDGEDLIPELARAAVTATGSRLAVVRFSVPTPLVLQKIHRILYFIWRIGSLSLWLMHALLFRVPTTKSNGVDVVLVQNPPALPTLLVAYLYCRIQGFLMIYGYGRKRPGLLIDWHNLGYSMFEQAGGGGSGSMIAKVAKIYETAVAPLADAHLTVTHAMKHLLERDILVATTKLFTSPPPMIQVVADCPPRMFQPRSLEEQHAILVKFDEALRATCPRHWLSSSTTTATTSNSSTTSDVDGIISSQTLFTECYYDNDKKKCYRPRRGRPALVTSSTSWTSDEDFGILLAALILLDEQIIQSQASSSSSTSSLKVFVVVTGKGPQKSMYEEQISRLTLQHVAVATLWLPPADYPRLIACADVGVSLHTSTSGFDLPMKVLDMFGCQVPVCAMDFACLTELVQDGVNGRIFNNSRELANLLWELLEPMTSASTTTTDNAAAAAAGPACHSFGPLARYSSALEGRERWSDNWLRHAQPVIMKTAQKHIK